MGITEAATALGFPKGVVHRLASTLVQQGFLSQNAETKKYDIGPQAFRVGSSFVPGDYANRITEPTLRRIASEQGLSTFAAILDDTWALFVGAHRGNSPIRVDSARKGDRRKLYSTAAGKALLTALSGPALSTLLDRLVFASDTEHTIDDRYALESELEVVRQRGYAVSNQESMLQIASVGALVIGLEKGFRPIAISVSVPAFSFNEHIERKLGELVLDAVGEIRRGAGL